MGVGLSALGCEYVDMARSQQKRKRYPAKGLQNFLDSRRKWVDSNRSAHCSQSQ